MANPDKRKGAANVQDDLKGMARGMKDEMVEAADEAKAEGVNQIGGISRAVHGAAEELRRELSQAAGYVHSLADRLESASSTLRERSVEDLMSDFNGFARRQPAAAFAGSVLAGFALSRFLKSSAPRPQSRR